MPSFPHLPVKRWRNRNRNRPTNNVKHQHKQNATGIERPTTDYSNLWIRTKCPLTGQESNLSCKPFSMSGNLAENARLVCMDFSNALARKLNAKIGLIFHADSVHCARFFFSAPLEFYIVDTDNHNYALVVSCAPTSLNNDDDDERKPNINAWAIFVKKESPKVLNRELVKELLGLVQHIGFKVGDIIEIPYEKCRF
jgi:hypothetical protein